MIKSMPHVSPKKIQEETASIIQKHFLSIIQNTGTRTRTNILQELLTETEQIMLAKRVGMLYLLKRGISPYKVSEMLGVSPSTAERFQIGMDRKKYQKTTEWLWKQTSRGVFDAFMQSLVSLAFTRRTQSFKKFVDEI